MSCFFSRLLPCLLAFSLGAVSVEAATVPIIPGLDERVTLVSPVDGSAVGTLGAPLSVTALGGVSVSTVNSSTTPLGAGATFTGTAEDVSTYAAVIVSVFSDQAAAVNFPAIQYSSNGTNWDIVESYEFTAIGVPFISAPKAKFCRVVYTNGATPQTAFRLQTIFHSQPTPAPFMIFNSPSANYPTVRSAASLTNGFGGGTQPALVTAYQNAAGTFDFAHNNQDVVVQASAATGTGTINTDLTNFNGQVFVAHANVTAYGAAGTFLMKLQIKDANNLFVDIPGATTGALTTGADLLLTVGAKSWPADTATAFYANFPLTRNLRLVEVVGVNSVTFASAYSLGGN